MRRRFVKLAALTACVATAAALVVGAAPVSAQKKQVVTIGVIAPLDAGLTSFGKGIANSTQLAVDQANKQKAIPGWTIKVEAVNDSSDPTVGATNVKTLLDDRSVVGIVGPYNSGVAVQVLPVLNGKVALVSPGNTLTSLTRGTNPSLPTRPDDNYFRVVGADSLQAEFLAEQAKKLGFTKAAIVSESKAVSQGLADQFAAAFKTEGGTVVLQQTVPTARRTSPISSTPPSHWHPTCCSSAVSTTSRPHCARSRPRPDSRRRRWAATACSTPRTSRAPVRRPRARTRARWGSRSTRSPARRSSSPPMTRPASRTTPATSVRTRTTPPTRSSPR
jgi:hypothetical protein